ncbi:MAG: L-ribulose-5-phosphate 3-epimerase [Culicoidibacterales bacterium]
MQFGIYEKALPKNISWRERFELAKSLGFDYVEISIDETDERLNRLNWNREERLTILNDMSETNIRIASMCLSGHRRFPFGSKDVKIREHALKIMYDAVDLAVDLGIRTIQLAGYDVYYEEKNETTRAYFIENLQRAVSYAASRQVVLAIEIMDDPFINSISKYLKIKENIPSPYLKVYPDLGNLSAWSENDVSYELEKGIDEIVAIHLKDTFSVTPTYAGKFKEVPFGAGCVDFVGCLKTLKRLNYGGSFLIEMWSETEENPIPYIKEAKAFIETQFKEADYES